MRVAVFCMGAPRLKALLDLLFRDKTGGVVPFPFLDPPLHALLGGFTQLADRFSGSGEIDMETAEVDAVPQREDYRLLVQFIAQFCEFHSCGGKQRHRLLFCLSDCIPIVHIHPGVRMAEILIDEMKHLG